MKKRSLREMGYRLKRLNLKHTAYLVFGKRGSRYLLIRNQHRPEHLFSINENHLVRNDKIHGYSWFIEMDGEVYPLR